MGSRCLKDSLQEGSSPDLKEGSTAPTVAEILAGDAETIESGASAK
jgi:hypothetical protein